MKTPFKINQKVFDYSYGWGKVSEMEEQIKVLGLN